MGAHTMVLFGGGRLTRGIWMGQVLGQLGLQVFCRKFFKNVRQKENVKTAYSGKMLVFLKVLSRMALLA